MRCSEPGGSVAVAIVASRALAAELGSLKIACTRIGIADDTLSVYAILDTCVLVSGLRSKRGASYQVLRAVFSGQIQLAISVSLIMEYEDVALRPGLIPSLQPSQIVTIIDGLCKLAKHQQIFYTWRPLLPDPYDDLILELALAANAPFIITHNITDFRGSGSLGIKAVTPAQTLTLI